MEPRSVKLDPSGGFNLNRRSHVKAGQFSPGVNTCFQNRGPAMRYAVLLCLAIAALPVTASADTNVRSVHDLLCNGIINVPIDLSGYPVLESATLRGRSFTGWIAYARIKSQLRESHHSDAVRTWTLGFQLDSEVLTAINTSIPIGNEAILLTFSNLSAGRHHLTIGGFSAGTLFGVNRYCFTVPQSTIWSNGP
jgi:hypothetical protein